ncbi:cysteine-rich CWC family protein [Marinomonas sp. THO17]|uniref:cysteine-rich CWC family protein n=1 Tax=Marinomonas sp. THO17 TaxID=3149048 RepID=UPI00336BFC3A
MSKCPFCQQDAACGLEKEQACWCFVESIPQQMLALLPIEAQGTACVCHKCIRLYSDNPDLFRFAYVEKNEITFLQIEQYEQ